MSNRAITNAKVIFVDYYDTLVFRYITVDSLINRWAQCLQAKYPNIPNNIIQSLPRMRKASFRELRENASKKNARKTEVTYEEAIGNIFYLIEPYVDRTNKESFISISKRIDFALECGCQYANKRIISMLKSEREKGKKIYCVSDFYLNKEQMKQLMVAANIPDDLICEVFVSCDVGKRKAIGDMYSYLLEHLDLDSHDVVMIGDNKVSDYERAIENGLSAVLYRHIFHKYITYLKSNTIGKFLSKQMNISMNDIFYNGQDYGEYIAIFYVFIKRLHSILKEEKVEYIAFMAREGFYLKKLFKIFEEITVQSSERIKTSYYWCSRRSVMAGIREAVLPEYINDNMSLNNWLKSLNISISEAKQYLDFEDSIANEICYLPDNTIYKQLMSNKSFRSMIEDIIIRNKKAFMAYTESFIRNGIFRFVDSGWKSTTQNAIQKGYGINTKGYYIGTQISEKPTIKLERKGIIFSESEPRSRYYDYLGTNIPFYQQLLSAPHGTAVRYVLDQEKIKVYHEWDPIEKKLYKNYIKKLQDYMFLKFQGLCAWDTKSPWDKEQDWFIARLSMRSGLFANYSRQKFIKMCTDNYVQNFRQEKRGKVNYDPRKVKIGIDILWTPEKYVRYISKIQRTDMYDKKAIKIIYPVLSFLYYLYVLFIHFIKK